MKTTERIYKILQQISGNYYSGTPPIHIDGLSEELKIGKDELLPILTELEAKGIIYFHNGSRDVIILKKESSNNAPGNGNK